MRQLRCPPDFLIVRPVIILLALVCRASFVTAAESNAGRASANLERQRQSILRQTRGQGTGSFFLSPWLPTSGATVQPAMVKADCEPLPDDRLRELIASAVASYPDLSPRLIRAVIRRESGARPCAVSDKGAQGLMQLMPATQQTMGVSDPFDPVANMAGGTRYLADLFKRYKGDLRRTLAAYNAGPQRVESEGDLPDIAETRAYVTAIMAELDSTPAAAP